MTLLHQDHVLLEKAVRAAGLLPVRLAPEQRAEVRLVCMNDLRIPRR